MSRSIPFFNVLINFFFPHNCIFCGKKLSLLGNEYYCDECKYKINLIDNDNRCLICGRERGAYGSGRICTTCTTHKMYFDAAYPCFKYTAVIKNLIHKYKFRKQMFLYKPIADFMINTMEELGVPKYDYIVYPPVNRLVFIARGYNQTKFLAQRIGCRYSKAVLKNAVVKTRQNRKQSLMTREMRFENVKGVFKIRKKFRKIIKGKNILIVDDVITTGATASEIAKMLKKCGAMEVYVTVLAVSGE